jgi:two-component system response regulator HydG
VKARVLVVDDDHEMLDLLRVQLGRRGYDVAATAAGADAFARLGSEDFDVMVTDLNMRGMNGIELCQRAVANRPDVPVLVITAFGSLETAVAAIRAGAYDFLAKPFDADALAIAVDRAVQHRALRAEVTRLREVVTHARGTDEIVGGSAAMSEVFELLARVAQSEATVLITGESGTGKELAARAIHARSRRGRGPFVAVNCAALPEALLESELFGHARGAFTDAKASRVGLFAQADGGVLLLDEIGELPLGLQPKLLRALQERKVRPVGSDVESAFDVRVIAATNRDLQSDVEDRKFREDLYYRINVIHVGMPPLRSRGGDVLLLAQRFIRVYAAREGKSVVGLSPPVAERLLAYAWPGNVRELQNCMERAVALARFDEIMIEDLPERVRDYHRVPILVDTEDPTEMIPLEEVERRYVLRVLEAVGDNKSLAAQVLGLDRSTLYRKLERYRRT